MAKIPDQKPPAKIAAPTPREARLKAALKANLARRKAQARKRQAVEKDEPNSGN